MGMDVYGKDPDDEVGKYFRNNVWWWHPLWNYAVLVGDDLISEDLAKIGHSNSGAGLDAADAKLLADKLEAEIFSGRTEAYSVAYKTMHDGMPDVDCEICAGTGKRALPPNVGPGEMHCNGCEGKGKIRPFITNYPFSVENVQEFANFLRHCGGFEIC